MVGAIAFFTFFRLVLGFRTSCGKPIHDPESPWAHLEVVLARRRDRSCHLLGTTGWIPLLLHGKSPGFLPQWLRSPVLSATATSNFAQKAPLWFTTLPQLVKWTWSPLHIFSLFYWACPMNC